MNIVGIGIDLVKIERIQKAISRWEKDFLNRVFTENETRGYHFSKNKAIHLSGKFAAKEAAMKALGTGWSRGIRWKDIEIIEKKGVPPEIEFHGYAEKVARKMGIKKSFLSISHERDYAVAEVILTR